MRVPLMYFSELTKGNQWTREIPKYYKTKTTQWVLLTIPGIYKIGYDRQWGCSNLYVGLRVLSQGCLIGNRIPWNGYRVSRFLESELN